MATLSTKVKVSDIGAMNMRIDAEKLSIMQDGSGGFDETWTLAYQIWAFVGPVQSFRKEIEMQNIQQNTFEVQLRCEPGIEISKNIRFKFDGDIYIINKWRPFTKGRKRYWNVLVVNQQ